MKLRHIFKDRNKDSPESALKVKYIVSYGNNKSQKNIKLNPILFKKNLIPHNIKFKTSELRKEQFNSYSNENMDFFRLDHLFECDRNNYHNKFMDNIKPINRKENFEKFNEIGKKIKYLDYLKENYLLNQNKIINYKILSDKDLEIAKKREKYYKNKTIEKNDNNNNNIENKYRNTIESNRYNKNENNLYNSTNNNYNNNYYNTINTDEIYFHNNINKDNPYKRDKITKSYSAVTINDNLFKNNLNTYNFENNLDKNNKINSIKKNRNESYSNLYLSNINNYSIKEGDINLYEDTKFKLYPTLPKESLNSNKNDKILYTQDNYKDCLKNNPFYIAYNENKKNIGFLKRKGDFTNSENIYKNRFFLRNNSNDINNIIGNKNKYNLSPRFYDLKKKNIQKDILYNVNEKL